MASAGNSSGGGGGDGSAKSSRASSAEIPQDEEDEEEDEDLQQRLDRAPSVAEALVHMREVFNDLNDPLGGLLGKLVQATEGEEEEAADGGDEGDDEEGVEEGEEEKFALLGGRPMSRDVASRGRLTRGLRGKRGSRGSQDNLSSSGNQKKRRIGSASNSRNNNNSSGRSNVDPDPEVVAAQLKSQVTSQLQGLLHSFEKIKKVTEFLPNGAEKIKAYEAEVARAVEKISSSAVPAATDGVIDDDEDGSTLKATAAAENSAGAEIAAGADATTTNIPGIVVSSLVPEDIRLHLETVFDNLDHCDLPCPAPQQLKFMLSAAVETEVMLLKTKRDKAEKRKEEEEQEERRKKAEEEELAEKERESQLRKTSVTSKVLLNLMQPAPRVVQQQQHPAQQQQLQQQQSMGGVSGSSFKTDSQLMAAGESSADKFRLNPCSDGRTDGRMRESSN